MSNLRFDNGFVVAHSSRLLPGDIALHGTHRLIGVAIEAELRLKCSIHDCLREVSRLKTGFFVRIFQNLTHLTMFRSVKTLADRPMLPATSAGPSLFRFDRTSRCDLS